MTMTQTRSVSRRAGVAVWAPMALRLIVGYGLLYLACLVTLVLGGPGPVAIDTFIARRRRRSPGNDRG